ncbi:MAG: hypothetical protein FWE71_03705 [Nocardioidaceae bacterium]|nr:hypothetical protein [Nocardioidaceae bacterium]MCL2613506.1 hypothetical protein [Nocardioidaceae bacterium]
MPSSRSWRRLPDERTKQGVADLLDLAFAPTTRAWVLGAEGQWVRNDGTVDLQEALIEQQRGRFRS